MSQPIRTQYCLENGDIAAWHWPNPGQPVLVFAHANGFNGGVYRRFLQRLAERFEIIAPDLRGHGRTTLPANPDTHKGWYTYASDLLALFDQLDRAPALLAGHSMGAASTLLAASQLRSSPPLALIEPVILPFVLAHIAQSPLWPLFKARLAIADKARGRTNAWPDRQSVQDQYATRTTFKNWDEGFLADYLEDGLVETDTGVRLSCDPLWEAANFEAHHHNLLKAGSRLGSKAHILRASKGSTTMNAAGLKARGAQITPIEGGHLIAMENPQAVSDWIHSVADLEGI